MITTESFPGDTLHRLIVESPVGSLTLVASTKGLRAVLWPDDAASRVRLPPTERSDAHPALVAAARQLAEYFDGRRREFDVALDPVGTPFQLAAWAVLRTIPFGETLTYSEQAARLGDRRKARAIGAANSRNPISIVVPCHRVVGANGALTGFAGGLDTKAWLLTHESPARRLPR